MITLTREQKIINGFFGAVIGGIIGFAIMVLVHFAFFTSLASFAKTFAIVKFISVHNTSAEQLFEGATKGMLAAVDDPYTHVLTSGQLEQMAQRQIQTSTVVGQILKNVENTGQIRISSFSVYTAYDVQELLIEFKKAGVEHVIIDLISNPGGTLISAEQIVDLFLPEGKNMFYAEINNKTTPFISTYKYFDFEVYILVDHESASATELVAGALQHHNVATVVGEQTYGKGVGQSFFELPNGKGLRVTSLEIFFEKKVKSYNGIGIAPCVVVEDATAIKINQVARELITKKQPANL